jgi:predicted permease
MTEAATELQVAGMRLDLAKASKGLIALPVERGVMPGNSRLAIRTAGAGVVVLSSLVLLIACANLVNLLLARSVARMPETAIRIALGASPARILRLQFFETAIIAALGGMVGFVIVKRVAAVLGRFAISESWGVPVTATLLVDGRVVALFFLLCFAASVTLALVPALRATRLDPMGILASSGSRQTSTSRMARFRTVLVAGQVAVSTVLVVLAGLGARSALRSWHYDTAFETDQLLIGHVSASAERIDEQRGRTLQQEALTAARAIPGVRAAALATALPVAGGGDLVTLEAEGAPAASRSVACHCISVSTGFFEAIGPLAVRGRDFGVSDNAMARDVVIVNEVAAARLWPGREPNGARLRLSRNTPWLDVVGTVPETDLSAVDPTLRCSVFVPMAQRYRGQFLVAARTTGAPTALAQPLARRIADAAPGFQMFDVTTAAAAIERAGASTRPIAVTLAVLAAVGLAIALIGLYAVVAYVVALRRTELAIRKALGAGSAHLHALVMRDASRMLFLGTAAGVPIAYVVSILARDVLVGITPHDTAAFLIVPLLLVATGLLASWWPAYRGARTEPLHALRNL